MSTKSWMGTNKEFVRSHHTGTKDRRYTSILDLPGNLALSTKQFYNARQIGAWTDVVAIEGQASEIESVTKNLRGMDFKSVIVILSVLQEWVPDRSFDLVNLDLCASLRPDTLKWMAGLSLIEGGDVCINTMVVARCKKINTFKKGIKNTFRRGAGLDVINRLIDKYPVLSHEPEESLNVIAAITTSMAGYEFGKIHPSVSYKDGNPGNQMRVYNFCEARKCKPTISFFDIYSGDIDYSSKHQSRSLNDKYSGSSIRYTGGNTGGNTDEEIRLLIAKIGLKDSLKALKAFAMTPACKS